jgi:hypothetical protein
MPRSVRGGGKSGLRNKLDDVMAGTAAPIECFMKKCGEVAGQNKAGQIPAASDKK